MGEGSLYGLGGLLQKANLTSFRVRLPLSSFAMRAFDILQLAQQTLDLVSISPETSFKLPVLHAF
jgi:hypothetical protein